MNKFKISKTLDHITEKNKERGQYVVLGLLTDISLETAWKLLISAARINTHGVLKIQIFVKQQKTLENSKNKQDNERKLFREYIACARRAHRRDSHFEDLVWRWFEIEKVLDNENGNWSMDQSNHSSMNHCEAMPR